MKKLITTILTVLCIAIPAYAVQVTIDVPQTHVTYVTARANETGITPVQYLLKIIYADYVQYKISEYKASQEDALEAMQDEQQELLMNYIMNLTTE